MEDRDVSAIEGMIEPWTQACLNGDWDALLGMCTEDIVFMPPGEPSVSGDAVRPWLGGLVIRSMSWSIDQVEVRGDVAYLRGPVAEVLEIDGQEERFNGKYSDLMRRGEDGAWRFSVIMWNSDEA
jgi:ketosteroid isomerase-like protein